MSVDSDGYSCCCGSLEIQHSDGSAVPCQAVADREDCLGNDACLAMRQQLRERRLAHAVRREEGHVRVTLRRVRVANAGWRMEPPVSDPREAMQLPEATAAALPPELPPGT